MRLPNLTLTQWVYPIVVVVMMQGGVAYALCVNARKANLRSGPGSSHSVSWVVGRYTPLVRLKRQGAWYQVRDQDGQKHWVYRKLVSKGLRCLAIKSTISALRRGPGTNYGYTEKQMVDRYTPFQQLDRKGQWYQVKDQFGQKHWVHESNVWRPLKVTTIGF